MLQLVNELQPRLKHKEAESLADGLIDVSRSKECEIPWIMLLTIATKESSLNNKAYNKKTKDSGLMQINDKTIERLHLNKKKLLSDVRYNIQIGCYLLTDNKTRYSHKKPYWIGIYNSGTKLWDKEIVKRAKAYDQDVQTRLNVINERLEKITVDSL